jgi:hypothetical protein
MKNPEQTTGSMTLHNKESVSTLKSEKVLTNSRPPQHIIDK